MTTHNKNYSIRVTANSTKICKRIYAVCQELLAEPSITVLTSLIRRTPFLFWYSLSILAKDQRTPINLRDLPYRWYRCGQLSLSRNINALSSDTYQTVRLIRKMVDYQMYVSKGIMNYTDTVRKKVYAVDEEEVAFESKTVADAKKVISNIDSNKEKFKDLLDTVYIDLIRISKAKTSDINENDVALVYKTKRVIENREDNRVN